MKYPLYCPIDYIDNVADIKNDNMYMQFLYNYLRVWIDREIDIDRSFI